VGLPNVVIYCENLTVGSAIDVFYSPDDPNNNIAQKPEMFLENKMITVAIMTIIFPALILIAFRMKR
jgi:hypothetical protein